MNESVNVKFCKTCRKTRQTLDNSGDVASTASLAYISNILPTNELVLWVLFDNVDNTFLNYICWSDFDEGDSGGGVNKFG